MLEHMTAGEPAANQKPDTRQSSQKAQRLRLPTPWEWLAGVLILAAVGLTAFNVFQPITVLPRITTSPGYAFTNQDGELVTSEDYRGRFTLYSFSHSACGETCALTLEQIAAVRDDLAARLPNESDVSLVTISVDPDYDQPEMLQATAQQMGLSVDQRPVSWNLLSGDALRTKMAVGSGFSLYFSEAEQVAENGSVVRQITFDPRFYLVDGWGIIRAEYRTAEPDPEILARDVRLLMQEAENSDGLIRLGYEAAHLFSCYPR